QPVQLSGSELQRDSADPARGSVESESTGEHLRKRSQRPARPAEHVRAIDTDYPAAVAKPISTVEHRETGRRGHSSARRITAISRDRSGQNPAPGLSTGLYRRVAPAARGRQ